MFLPNSKFVLVVWVIQSVFPFCCSQHTSIPACPNYHGRNKISISGIAVSGIAYDSKNTPSPLEFELQENVKLACQSSEMDTRQIFWQSSAESTHEPRSFVDADSGTSSPHNVSYFTSAGYFYDNETSTYYAPTGDYCVKEYSNNGIILQVCAVNKDCSTPNTWCIPKCCAMDEHFLYFKKQCAKRTDRLELTPWMTPLFQGPENPHTLASSKDTRVLFRLAHLPKHCAMTFPTEEGTKIFFKHYNGAPIQHPKDPSRKIPKENIKLAAPSNGKSGIIRPMGFLAKSRHWNLPDLGTFCVDQFYVKGNNNVSEHEWIIVDCSEDKQAPQTSSWGIWLYVVVSGIALIFLVATVAVYLVLFGKQNLHGLTILSYSMASLLSYLFLLMAHVISLYAEQWGKSLGVDSRGGLCYAVGVFAHYFFLTSYLWLTVMNFDLWMVFRSMKSVSRESKQKWMTKFGWYSAFAWAFPALLVAIFVGINEGYRDPESEVAVPGYAEGSCFVATEFRAEYVYIPMAILLSANIILIALTMLVFIKARQNTGNVLRKTDENANRYNASLFIKLFVVMGGASLIDFVTWYYNNKGESKHGIIVVLECILYLTPVWLFVIFCMTDRILNQMREKYPKLMRMKCALNPLLRLCGKAQTGYGVNSPEVSKTESNKTNSSYDMPNDIQRQNSENLPLKSPM